MAYSSKEKRNAYARKYKQENKQRISEQIKNRRRENPEIAEKDRQRYLKNRDRIIKKQKEYQNKNPDVRKRYQKKFKESGGYKKKGKEDREKLTNAYLLALIRSEGSDKTIEQKKVEVLKYRIRKQIFRLSKLQKYEKQNRRP